MYSPGPVEGASRDTWQVRSSAELLALKICDPACGSGAFLVAACRYLAERVAEAWQHEGWIADDEPIRDAQRIISERCLYGVDRDPMAVEMAKLSLWLLTFARQRPFGFLDHAIREGDSLLGITSLDQLRALHFDPERGRALHDGSLFDVLRPLGNLVDEAVQYRLQLEEHATLDIGDAYEKARLDALASESTETGRLIADALTAIAICSTEPATRELDSAFLALGHDVRAVIGSSEVSDRVATRIEEATRSVRSRMDREKPESAPKRRPLHWPLEFPEVFARENGGFDLVLGNPPFLGGKFISGRFGSDYRSFLVRWLAAGKRGHADLVAYFFLQASAIARRFGFIATNTIGQGDTREVALDELLDRAWSIHRAEKSRAWPGAAAIQVAEVWFHREKSAEPAILSGLLVPGISALLVPTTRISGHPFRLKGNDRISFIGGYALGAGFVVTPARAQELTERRACNREVLFPYVNADDVCNLPEVLPRRYIINFGERDQDSASQFKECFAQVAALVQPERKRSSVAVRKYPWWLHWRSGPELHRASLGLTSIVAMPLHSKYSIPVRLPSGYEYSHGLAVFASESDTLYGIVSSEVHRVWSRMRGSTIGNTSRYTPSDCFETFALPNQAAEAIGNIIGRLHDHRSALMRASCLGSTGTYNRVHSSKEADEGVLTLREMHRTLDLAVLAAYGWQDIDLEHDFRLTDEGLRFTISERARVEILDRLLELNHERHAAEIASGVWNAPRRLKNGAGRRRDNAGEHTPEPLELH